MSRGLLVIILIPVLIVAGSLTLVSSFRNASTSSGVGMVTKAIYERDFGTVTNPIASTWQGTTLLGMLGEHRPESVVRLKARDQTSGDQVQITVDMNEQVITRRKTRTDGHGSSEVWKGYVMYRLESAASGDGSLNHTPDGAKASIYTTF